MSNQPQPTRWWQWILIYPALLTTSYPTLLELYRSHKYEVGFGLSSGATTRNGLWERNFDCVASEPVDSLVTASNMQIDATICKSGDVLVRGQAPDHRTYYQWLPLEQLTKSDPKTSFSFKLIDSALAEENVRIPFAQPTNVMCQRWIASGRLLRRIQVSGQGCFDEIVNTYTGYVESSTPAQCSKTC